MGLLLVVIFIIISILIQNIVVLSNIVNRILSSVENIFNLLYKNLYRESV
jgi:hypothetical protein